MNQILQGTVFDMLPTIEPWSIDCCVSSPPYWQLRSYLPRGHQLKALELGQEKTPQEFVANMVRVFSLVRDCLAEHGTCWINIGDSYSGGKIGNDSFSDSSSTLNNGGARTKSGEKMPSKTRKPTEGIEAGNLCLIPQRLAIALQDDGWYVRSVVIWHKPSAMPSSVKGWSWQRCRVKVSAGITQERINGSTRMGGNDLNNFGDGKTQAEWKECPGCKKCEPNGGYVLRRGSWRPTSSYEPILMLAKSSSYFADGEPVKTPAAESTISRDKYTRVLEDPDEQFAVAHDHETVCDSGANLRDVWRIAAEPLKEKHYAAYPTELVRKCLQSSVSAKGYCPACAKPWVRILESAGGPPTGEQRKRQALALDKTPHADGNTYGGTLSQLYAEYGYPETKTIGWRQSCNCIPLEPRPGRVLDPFCGSGRTGIAAMRLGLDFVGCELNPEYAEMGERILRDESPLFA